MPRTTIKTEIEAEVYFTASNDGDNPNEYFIDDMQMESLWMFGREWEEKELRLVFGDQGADAMLQLIGDQIEEWDDE